MSFFKPIHVHLKPGDCLHIPAFWWYQIKAQKVGENSKKLKILKKLGKETDKKVFSEEEKQLSNSIQFWYAVQSYWLDNVFYGI